MKKFTQKSVQLLAVICMVVLTTFSAKADQVVITDSDLPTSYPTATVYEIGGVSFCLNSVANYGNGIQIKKTSGYIYNTTELADIASITFTEKEGKSYAVTVYEGTEENPSANVVTGVDGVYTFSSGMNYFSIVGGSSASYLDAITITYSEEATTSIIAPSQLAMGSISCGSTTTSSLAIKGTLLTSDVTVSLAGDDAFAAETATYSADEVMAGVNFAITFTAPETAGDFTATVTISSSECETIEVAVSATAAGAVTIADIFSMDDNETAIIATATVDYVYTYGSYISDESGKSILAYYLTDVEIGDVLSNISATVATYNSVKQIKSVSYESSVAGESTIEPIEITLAELMGTDGIASYGGQLVTVKGVTLAATGFTSNKITLTQDETTSTLYNGFYITNDDFPTWADVTGYVTVYSNAAQINPRWQDDVVASEEEQGETDEEEQDDDVVVEYVTIADIFAMDDAATGMVATATVDFVYTYGSYISDENGTSIYALYLTDVEVGDVLTDISFTAGSYYGLKQMTSVSYESLVAGESTIEPIVITIAELMDTDGLDLYAHQLVTVEEVTFASTTFATSNTITQDGTSTLLYNKFGVTVDGDLPSPANVTGYVNAYSSVAQIYLRSAEDIVATSSSAIVMTEASTTAVAGATGAIVVKAAAATTATIYNTIGQVVAIVEVEAGESAVTLAQGLYLVSVDGAVTKAVVR